MPPVVPAGATLTFEVELLQVHHEMVDAHPFHTHARARAHTRMQTHALARAHTHTRVSGHTHSHARVCSHVHS